MAHAPINHYTPLDPTIPNSALFFYPLQASDEATYYSCGPGGTPNPGHSPNSVSLGPLTPRRRSSYSNKSYPYDTSRSPTRARFNFHDPNILSPENIFHSSTCPFPANSSGFLGPERHNKSYGRPRASHEDSISQTPGKLSKSPSALNGPTNHILIPQALFQEPASDPYRYPDVMFHVANFPEVGVKVGALNRTKIPLLSGGDDPVFQNVQEREIRVRILWPGYSAVSFEKRLKTLQGSTSRTRTSVVVKLAQIILEFSQHLRLTREQVEPGQEQWQIGPLGITCSNVFITRLIHRGGSHWQMELWAPKERI